MAAELLHLERSTLPETGRYRFSPLVSWLVATARPEVVVEVGPGDEGSLRSTCEAVLRSEDGRTCAAVLLSVGSPIRTEDFKSLTSELSRRFGPAFQGYETEHAGLVALRDGMAGLLHLSLFDSDDVGVPDLAAWHEVMAPGAVVVVTTTASDVSSNFAEVKQRVMDTYPAVSISLGLTTEAIVAQRPVDDGTPIVDTLRKAPFAVGAFLTMFGEQVELHELLAREPEPSEAVRALIGRIIDQHYAERDAFLSALRVYEDETARVSNELRGGQERVDADRSRRRDASGSTSWRSSSTVWTSSRRRSRPRRRATGPNWPTRTRSSKQRGAKQRPTQGRRPSHRA